MTLYRKYRPQTLSQLDSSEVRDRLIRVFSSPYIPHALLFTGSRGTGKTSAARIVAKILNCEVRIKNQESRKESKKASKTPRGWQAERSEAMTPFRVNLQGEPPTVEESGIEPCNTCETCVSITDGRNLDVLEIDAASNRGIDEIRDLREKIKLAPISARYKVYIIDEVHMLTQEAFNALLKTLEEPPAHAVFILATTEPEKLPGTILSRCITFNFKRAIVSEIVHCLKRVIEGEKFDIAEELLIKIAHTAEGSFRDATKILEQAISENAVTLEKLSVLLGRDSLTSEKFLKLLADKELKETLVQINKMIATGVNIRFLVEDILRLLHQILLIQHNVEEDKTNADMAKLFETQEVLQLVKLFSRVFVELKNTSMQQLPLEVAMVEWCEGKN